MLAWSHGVRLAIYIWPTSCQACVDLGHHQATGSRPFSPFNDAYELIQLALRLALGAVLAAPVGSWRLLFIELLALPPAAAG